MEIIVKSSYSHVNKAFSGWDTPEGKLIKNKDHYDRTMKEQGMISYEEMQRRSENKNLKEYKVSKDSLAIIQAAKNSKTKNGQIHLGDKTIKALIDKKVIGKKIPSYMQLPSAYSQGGFTQ